MSRIFSWDDDIVRALSKWLVGDAVSTKGDSAQHMELAEWLVHWAPKLASRVDAQLGHLNDACTSLPQKS